MNFTSGLCTWLHRPQDVVVANTRFNGAFFRLKQRAIGMTFKIFRNRFVFSVKSNSYSCHRSTEGAVAK